MTLRHLRPLSDRSGMTLVEMLVATAATLMLMGAIAQVFSVFGSAVTNSRSMIEQDARLRSVAWRLRTDLGGATARTLPPLEPSAGEGYLEIIEGNRRDGYGASGAALVAGDIVGDIDDILLFTTHNSDTGFLGKAGAAMIESPTAEVAWFLRATPGTSNPTTYTLFRRQLLVVGYAGFSPFITNNTASFSTWSSQWNTFFDNYDISVRREGASLVPNTLADLTRRESRFMHNPNGITNGTGYPYAFDASVPGLFFDIATSPRTGEDVVLTNVIAFDIRVFDPAAPVSISGDSAAVPGDAGFSSGSSVSRGCYVDLGSATAGVASHFSATAQGNYRLQAMGLAGSSTWDTWSSHYETNGIDEDGIAGIDQGSNGLDDAIGAYAQNGQIDEPEEQETAPPYPFPLRGLEVRIRCYEPSNRQVRQVTVRHTFVPH
jgi:type II secretory pathway component PulJ